MLRLLSQVLAVVAALLALSGGAFGHAVVLESDPADGALLERPPGALVIRFNEPVRPIRAQVLDANGGDVTQPDAVSVRGPALMIGLPHSLAPGSYIASYRVVSIDSHPVGGSIVFSVGKASSRVTAPTGPADDTGWRLAMMAVRAVLYAGILGGAGGVLFILLVGPAEPVPARAARRLAAVLAASGCLAALMVIGIQGGLLLGGPAASLGDVATWRIGLLSDYGTSAATAMAGLALVAIGLWSERARILRPLAWLGAASALASFALSGHIVTAGPRWLTVPVLIAHVAAVAFWAGALGPLLQALSKLGRAAEPIVVRFSRIAIAMVAILVAAGVIIAVLQVQSVSGLVETSYGLILIAKIGMLAGLIGLAAANKLRLTPALARGAPTAVPALRRSIATEIGLVLVILVATAALGTTPPPRALADGVESHAGHINPAHGQDPPGLLVTIVSAGRSAGIVLDSARSGTNRADVALLDGAGELIEAQSVTFVAFNRAAGVEPIRRTAQRTGPGTWRVAELLLVPAGRWSLRVDVLVSDFEKAVFETVLELR